MIALGHLGVAAALPRRFSRREFDDTPCPAEPSFLLSSRGVVTQTGHFTTLRSAYLRSAQDAIRQYRADALVNGLQFDRHGEEQAIEAFADRVVAAGANSA